MHATSLLTTSVFLATAANAQICNSKPLNLKLNPLAIPVIKAGIRDGCNKFGSAVPTAGAVKVLDYEISIKGASPITSAQCSEALNKIFDKCFVGEKKAGGLITAGLGGLTEFGIVRKVAENNKIARDQYESYDDEHKGYGNEPNGYENKPKDYGHEQNEHKSYSNDHAPKPQPCKGKNCDKPKTSKPHSGTPSKIIPTGKPTSSQKGYSRVSFKKPSSSRNATTISTGKPNSTPCTSSRTRRVTVPSTYKPTASHDPTVVSTGKPNSTLCTSSGTKRVTVSRNSTITSIRKPKSTSATVKIPVISSSPSAPSKHKATTTSRTSRKSSSTPIVSIPSTVKPSGSGTTRKPIGPATTQTLPSQKNNVNSTMTSCTSGKSSAKGTALNSMSTKVTTVLNTVSTGAPTAYGNAHSVLVSSPKPSTSNAIPLPPAPAPPTPSTPTTPAYGFVPASSAAGTTAVATSLIPVYTPSTSSAAAAGYGIHY